MKCSDVAGVGSRNDAHTRRFQKHEILKGDGPFRCRRNSRNAAWNFTLGNLSQIGPGGNHLRIAVLLFDIIQRYLLVEDHAITVFHPERSDVKDVTAFNQVDKFVIHEAIRHAVHEYIGAGAKRGLRRFKFRRVYSNTDAASLALLDCGGHDLNLLVEIVARPSNPPKFDEIGLPVQLPAHKVTGFSWRVWFDDVWIISCRGWRKESGNQGPCDGNTWRLFCTRSDFPDIKIPHGSAAVHDSRHPRGKIFLKRGGQALFDPLHLFRIWAARSQIDLIGPGVEAAGLRKVNMSIDEPRKHPLPSCVDDLRIIRHTHLIARSDVANASGIDDDRSVANGRIAGAGDQSRALNDRDSCLLLLRGNNGS